MEKAGADNPKEFLKRETNKLEQIQQRESEYELEKKKTKKELKET